MLLVEGVKFRTFECSSEGEYAPEDAAWNYFDIPHLQYVHKQVEGCQTLAADAIGATVLFQKIPFLRIPLTLLTYQTAHNVMTYYTSFSFYLVIVETSWEAVAEGRTRVTTRYAIGWTGWLAGFGYPLIKWLLERNYRILMSEDLPMRNQRGVLRKQGYDFKLNGPMPSFLESRKIMQHNVLTPEQNVVAPRSVASWGETVVLYAELVDGKPIFVGDANHIGLSILRTGNSVYVFPRLCPHEGAGLEQAVEKCGGAVGADADACTIQCPWHGRKFRPILSIALPATAGLYETDWHYFETQESSLRVICKTIDDENLRRTDWSRRAQSTDGKPFIPTKSTLQDESKL